MGKQMAVESEGLGPRKIYLDLDLCVFRHTEGEGFLKIESKVSGSDLENLARDCFDELADISFARRYLRQGCGNRELRLWARDYTLAILLGEERFRKAIASTKEKWDKWFAAAAEIARNLEPCKSCGAKRHYWDYEFSSTDGYCGACDQGMGQSDDRSELRLIFPE